MNRLITLFRGDSGLRVRIEHGDQGVSVSCPDHHYYEHLACPFCANERREIEVSPEQQFLDLLNGCPQELIVTLPDGIPRNGEKLVWWWSDNGPRLIFRRYRGDGVMLLSLWRFNVVFRLGKPLS